MRKKTLINHLRKSNFSTLVIDAFENIKRESFIPFIFKANAYGDHPLPLGEGSTISQPSTIAFMLDLLELNNDGLRFLEIGSGCGYVVSVN